MRAVAAADFTSCSEGTWNLEMTAQGKSNKSNNVTFDFVTFCLFIYINLFKISVLKWNYFFCVERGPSIFFLCEKKLETGSKSRKKKSCS